MVRAGRPAAAHRPDHQDRDIAADSAAASNTSTKPYWPDICFAFTTFVSNAELSMPVLAAFAVKTFDIFVVALIFTALT